MGSKPLPHPESVEGLKTQPQPQEEATGNSNWFGSIFGFKKKESAVQQGIVWSLCQSHQSVTTSVSTIIEIARSLSFCIHYGAEGVCIF